MSIRTAIPVFATTVALVLASQGAVAQPGNAPATAGQELTVVRCNAAANSCDETRPAEQEPDVLVGMPALGGDGRATVVSRDLRSTGVQLETADYEVLVPGCLPTEPGVLECQTRHEYQHCRTLMFSRMVHSCRAGSPFAGGFADPRPADPDEYTLVVESSARVRVTRGNRGFAQPRGSARVELMLAAPDDDFPGAWCVERSTMLFSATGREGGVADIDDAEACDAPIEFTFRANDDDALRAYDTCNVFAAWGDTLEDSIDILVAGLFEIRSSNPDFATRYEDGVAFIAPWVTVEAPLTITCDD